MTSRQARNIGIGIILGVAIPNAALVIWALCDTASTRAEFDRQRAENSREFDAEIWRANPTTDGGADTWPVRQCMAVDLVESGRLDGLTRDGVLELLEPLTAEEKRIGPENMLAYIAGTEREWGIEHEYLEITFDESGMVRESRVVGHSRVVAKRKSPASGD